MLEQELHFTMAF